MMIKSFLLVINFLIFNLFINILDDDKVVIDNQPFNITNINDIAFKVLNKCNISKSKNRNNNKMLKAREGKLMMTNGISISEFQKKYKLN